MSEIVFLVEDAAEGGLVARALGHAITPMSTATISCASRCAMRCSAISTPANARP